MFKGQLEEMTNNNLEAQESIQFTVKQISQRKIKESIPVTIVK